MRPIGRIVGDALRAIGVDRDVARADAVRAWTDAATAVFGPDGRSTRAIRAEGSTLVIVVPGAHWAGEIRLRERELVAAITRRAPDSGITRLRPVPAAAPER